MSGIFGFSSDTDSDRRKTGITYGKLARPAGKLARPHGTATGKLPAKAAREPSALSRPSERPSTQAVGAKVHKQSPVSGKKASPRPERDEWDMSSDEETPRASKSKTVSTPDKKSTMTGRLPMKQKTVPKSISAATSPLSNKRKRTEGSPSKLEAQPAKRPVNAPVGAERQAPRATERRKASGSGETIARSLQTGKSAPARLSEMADEIVVKPAKAPETSPQRTPRPEVTVATSTPPRQRGAPPASIKKALSLTPKQSRLWTQLLDPDDNDVRPIRSSTLSFGGPLSGPSHPQKPASPVARPSRQRLADRLKQDSQLTNDDSSSDEEELSDDIIAATPGKDVDPSTSFASQNLEATATKHTYSQSRSFLQETMSFEDSLSQPMLPDVSNLKGKFQSELDLEMEEEAPTNLRSVHELRAAGSRKRFLDDLEAIMDDVKEHSRGSWSRRRSALMELFQKLIGTDYAARFVESSFSMALVKEFTTQDPRDEVADTILFAIIANLTFRDLPLHLVDSLHSVAVLSWLLAPIGHDKKVTAIAKERANNMSKMSQESYLDFMETVKHALLWQGMSPKVMGSEMLALKALHGILAKTRKAGQRCQVLAEPQQVQKLIAHLNKRDSQDADAAFKRSLALGILEAESLSMTMQRPGSSLLWTASTTQGLLMPFAAMLLGGDSPPEDLAIYLRLLLNITNNQPANCGAFTAIPTTIADLLSYISDSFDKVNEPETDLDLLLLSLGLAINLAEHSDAVRQRIAPSTLSTLTQIFVRGEERSSQAASLEQSRANVAYGYLAIFLANACLNTEVKITVRKQLPGSDMSMLVRSIEEFLGYHRRVDQGEQLDEDGVAAKDEAWTSFTERLGAVVERLRA